MTRFIIKPILIGIFFGAAAFFAPFFLIKAILFFMFIGFIFRMFSWRRRWGQWYQYQTVFTDKVRNMSEEEYSSFKNKMNNCNQHYYSGCGDYYNRWHCDNRGNENSNTDSKKENNSENK